MKTGKIFVTLAAVAILALLAAGGALAFPPKGPNAQGGSPTVVSYQGRVMVGGSPYSGTGYFKFAIVNAAGNTSYWSNDGTSSGGGEPSNAVQIDVEDGLFSVLLGDTSLTNMTEALSASVFSGTDRYLRVWFGTSAGGPFTLLGDQRISSVPFALQAEEAKNADTLDGEHGSYYRNASNINSGTLSNARFSAYSDLSEEGKIGTGSDQVAAGDHDHDGAYWSLTGNSGTTSGNFLGTTDNVALTLRVSNTVALRIEPNAESPNIIGGYSGNSVTSGVKGATIGGGGKSGATNRVTDDYGTVGGGRNNRAGDDAGTTTDATYATVGGGGYNDATAYAATVGGGLANYATALYATVGGGLDNDATGGYATVGGGEVNRATAPYATVPGGFGARAFLYGQIAYASGIFANTGDAQFSLYVLRRKTTSSRTWENLYLDGSSARLTIESGRTLAFDILVVGRSDRGESAGYQIYGVIENVVGTTSLITSTVTTIGEDDTAWDAQVVADDTNDALLAQVMGAGENIRWVAVVRTAEVSW